MNGMPSFVVIDLSSPAVSSASCSDSMTQGPAMRKSGLSGPTSKPQRFIVRSLPDRHPGEGRDPAPCLSHHLKAGSRPSPGRRFRAQSRSRHRFLRQPRRLAIRLLLARCPDEPYEQRMPVARRRGELRMELAGEKPRMVRELDHLDEQIVHRLARDHEPQILELLPIAVVELVAMAMALADHVLAVELTRERARLEPALLRA